MTTINLTHTTVVLPNNYSFRSSLNLITEDLKRFNYNQFMLSEIHFSFEVKPSSFYIWKR